jgi:hypothetical protein
VCILPAVTGGFRSNERHPEDDVLLSGRPV